MAIDFQESTTIDFQSQDQPVQQEQPKTRNPIATFTRGLANAVPGTLYATQYYKNLLSGLPHPQAMQQAEMTTNQIEQTAADGLTAKLAEVAGGLPGFLATSNPFMKGASLIPKAGAITKAAVGLGAYEGARSAYQGNDPKKILDDSIKGAFVGATFGVGGKVGATLGKAVGPRVGSAIGAGAAGAVTSPEDPLTGAITGAGFGALYPSQPANLKSDKIAARLNNSLIKPAEKQLLYGDPGGGIAKEGIVANSLDSLGTKVSTRLEEVNKSLQNTYENAHSNVKLDLKNTLQPLYEAKAILNKAPATNEAVIKRIDNILSDIKGSSLSKNIDKLSPKQAVELKRFISDFQDWGAQGDRNRDVNIAVRKVYHNIDNAIDTALPETQLLNKRVTDLITAKKAIEHRRTVLERSNMLGLSPRLTGMVLGGVTGGVPGGVGGYASGVGLEKLLGSTAVKSRVAAGMANQYEKSPVNKILNNSAGKAIGGAALLSTVMTNQSQASEDIDMKKIYGIESSNNPKAFNEESKARGIGQITPIALKEWNNFHPKDKHTEEDLFDENINKKISSWLMNKRIPQMLKHYKKPDNPKNRLISYNAGIKYVVKGLPLKKETKDYLKKYGIK